MAFDVLAFLENDLEPRINQNPRLRDQLKSTSANVHIELLEAPDGQSAWYIALSEGVAKVHRGTSSAPSFTLRGHILDFVDLLEGFASVRAALTDGRLQLEGDLGMAVRVTPLLFEVES